MDLYFGEKKGKEVESKFAQILGMCNFIPTIKHSNLIGVTEEEFKKKCNEATEKDTKIGQEFLYWFIKSLFN